MATSEELSKISPECKLFLKRCNQDIAIAFGGIALKNYGLLGIAGGAIIMDVISYIRTAPDEDATDYFPLPTDY